MTYSIGMLGPIKVEEFKQYLLPHYNFDDLPKGLGGTPVNIFCKELLERGKKVIIFTLDSKVLDEVILEGENLKICIGPFRPKRARDFFKAERSYLLHAIKRENPDILHAQWTYEYALAAQASGFPHVITAHDAPLSILRHNFIPYRIARTFMAYQVIGRASRVVSVSPYVADHLCRYMFYRGAKKVIPNGLPATLFKHGITRNDQNRPFTIFTVLSTWSSLKNGSTAIKAFNELKRSIQDAKMVMFGAGYGEDESAQHWARENAEIEGIEFAGYCSHQVVLNRMATEADVLLHPSLEESHGMPLSEAMALGIPVIGGIKSGGVPWVVNEGRAGILVDVSSPKKISDVLTRLANSSDERQVWGKKGKKYTEEHFSIHSVVNAYEAIYEELNVQK